MSVQALGIAAHSGCRAHFHIAVSSRLHHWASQTDWPGISLQSTQLFAVHQEHVPGAYTQTALVLEQGW